MKKSLIALAVLGAMVGAAQAQSSVTLYGKIDVGLLHTDRFGGVSQLNVQSGNLSTSRWGLMGSEDLGGGLKVNFQLEQGFNVDTGGAQTPGQQFSRNSWLGLSGGWGEVRIGKPWTAYDDVSGAINAMWDSTFSVENNFFAGTGSSIANRGGVYTGYNANPANTIKYTTPNFGGFSGAASYSLDENKAANFTVKAISVAYANGPIAAGLGFQTEGQGAGPNLKNTRLSASYDFGVAVLKGLYGQSKLGADKVNEYSIGADIPLGGAFALSTSYGYSKDNAVLGSEKRKGFTVGGLYTLSKRTDVYFGVTDWNGKTGGVKTDGDTKYGFGMRHSF